MHSRKSIKRNPRLLRDRLILFSRYPVPGKTKTRLIPALGPTGAADLQRRLTEKTLGTIRRFSSRHGIEVEICLEGGSKRNIRRWLGSDLIFSPQGPGNLGQRMYLAFLKAFQNGCRHVALLGTDIPELKASHLEQAFDALSECDLVLGPSTDGGYWLIGLNRPADLFHDIPWGSSSVLDETVALAKEKGMNIHQLDSLTDIDTTDDLRQFRPDLIEQGPYISIIIPTLNEGPHLKVTILKVVNEEAEIIVVDGGSTDDTVKRATAAGARVETSSRGRALQQNLGATVARGKVLLFLHADTHLPRDYIYRVFEELMDPRTIIGAFRFKTDLDTPLMKTLEFLANFRSQYLKLPYGDQGLFIRKSVFESVGGFPEVPIAEDLFLVRRLAKLGRIGIARVEAITSARRWQRLGLLRTTLINQIIVGGCYLGVSPNVLASLYGSQSLK